MNIVVKTASGHFIVRPDTTWERDCEDFYPPEFVEDITMVPVLFARISKPGRSIGKKFASRYYDALGYGILLYPENLVDAQAPESFAAASCLDHTSFICIPQDAAASLQDAGREFSISVNAHAALSTGKLSSETIEQAIADATRSIYVRTGDLIAIELSPRQPLCSRKDGKARITATLDDQQTLDFNIIF